MFVRTILLMIAADALHAISDAFKRAAESLELREFEGRERVIVGDEEVHLEPVVTEEAETFFANPDSEPQPEAALPLIGSIQDRSGRQPL